MEELVGGAADGVAPLEEDEPLALQVVHRGRGASGQAVPVSHHHHELVLEQLHHLQGRRVDGQRGEAHVGGAVLQVGQGLVGAGGGPEADLHPGVGAHEALEEGGEEVDEGLGGGGGAHAARGLALPSGQAVAQRVGLVEDAPRIVEGGLARLRQPHPPLRPDEEGLAELLLEGLDLVAHRRLGEIEPLGGAGEVEGVGDFPKRAQLRHLHPGHLPRRVNYISSCRAPTQ